MNVNAPGNYGSHAPPPQKGFPAWIIYVLAALGFFIVFGGVLAVLAIYGVRKYIASAKTVEARNSVTQIARDAATVYDDRAKLCPSASRSVPDSALKVRGKKYQSAPSEWDAEKATNAGFACLKFSMSSPQYYSYGYTAHGASKPGDGFEASANGDLTGDGVTSEFKLPGKINASGALDLAPAIAETNPLE